VAVGVVSTDDTLAVIRVVDDDLAVARTAERATHWSDGDGHLRRHLCARGYWTLYRVM